MSQTVAVVGAGIVGVSTAEWLRRAGFDVTLIDRLEPGSAEQTSYGNGGILARCAIIPVPTPGIWRKGPRMALDPNQPLFLRWSYLPRLLPWLLRYLASSREAQVRKTAEGLALLNLDTATQHLALARGTPAEAFVKPGLYAYVYPSRADFEADAFGWGLRAEHGITGQGLEGEALRAWDPHLSPRYNFAYLMEDHGYISSPGRYVAALADWFQSQGGRFQQADVQAVKALEQGVSLTIGGHDQYFDRLVLATGAFTDALSRGLGIKAQIEPERGYHLLLKKPNFMPKQALMVADHKYVVTPMEEGLRIAGVVEFGGFGTDKSKAPLDLLRRSIKQFYPELTWEDEESWLGFRPATLDSLPLVGPHPDHEQIFFAAGHQHVGLTGGPKTGRLVADMMAGRHPNVDLSAFAPDRFG
jgi:D-amino-acid dehydrogenase